MAMRLDPQHGIQPGRRILRDMKYREWACDYEWQSWAGSNSKIRCGPALAYATISKSLCVPKTSSGDDLGFYREKFPALFPVSREHENGDRFDCDCIRHHDFNIDVPTMEQAAIPNAAVETSQMPRAPAGTPQPIIDRLAKEALAIMRNSDVRERMLTASFSVQPEGPDQLHARIAREVPMWKELVECAGIKID
jgi:hypothetical protein